MLRRHYALSLTLAVIASLIFAPRALNSIRGFDKSGSPASISSQDKAIGVTGPHVITLAPWGPTQQTMDAARAGVVRNPAVLKRMGTSRFRLISFELIDGGKINGNIVPPESYRAVLFDYTRNLSYAATGRFESSTVLVVPNTTQPIPSDEEFDVAAAVVSRNPKFAEEIANGRLTIYRPMPPLVDENQPVGRGDRTLSVGLQSIDGSDSQIVGV